MVGAVSGGDKNALLALADRVEGLTGPSREVDALIWCALNGKRYKSHFDVSIGDGKAIGHTRVEYTEPPKRTAWVSGRDRGGDALPWTASLDAALTLVPEGDDICHTSGNGPWAGPFARIWTCDPNREEPFDVSAQAATPTLALAAAAIRARAELAQESRP